MATKLVVKVLLLMRLLISSTVTSQGALTVTAGGAGTTATGQFVTELEIN